MSRSPGGRPASLWRLLALVAIAAVALQLYFVLRIALMVVVDPASTTFQRSEMWRMAVAGQRAVWRHHWLPYARISIHLKRAVIASEDARFADHSGVEWDAIEQAWERNERAEARADVLNVRRGHGLAARHAEPRVVGGSTITQQLAKNVFLSGERNLPRKAQEFVVAMLLEAMLPKQRILELYLNHVEWGEGVFGAEAAARRYFGIGATQLGAAAAARLAVMLPAPKRFEKRPASHYVIGRTATLMRRMGAVDPP